MFQKRNIFYFNYNFFLLLFVTNIDSMAVQLTGIKEIVLRAFKYFHFALWGKMPTLASHKKINKK